MIPITLLNILVVFFAFMAQDKRFRPMLKLAFIVLAIVLGIRYGYGNDYFGYYEIYTNSFFKWDERQEYGWYILNNIAHPIGFMGLVFVLSCFEHYILYDIISRYIPPKWYWLAVFLYVFSPMYMLVGCSMMRQFLATLLGFYAVEFAAKRKWLYFFSLIAISVLIHKIAILLMPIGLLSLMKFDFSNTWIWLSIVLFILLYILYTNIDRILGDLAAVMLDAGSEYASNYLDEKTLEESDNGVGVKMILHYMIYIVLLFRNVGFLRKTESIFSMEVVLGCLILPFYAVMPMAIRTSWIYTTAEVLSIPMLLQNEHLSYIKYGALVLLIVITLHDYMLFWNSAVYGEYFREFKTIFTALQLI